MLASTHCFLLPLSQDTGEPGWWRGEVGGKEGVFPDNFVVMISEAEKEVGLEKEQNELIMVYSQHSQSFVTRSSVIGSLS